MRFTKQQRAEIIREFASRHGGRYDAALFVDEVEEKGEAHPAYEWFTWDDSEAANQYRIWQARVFANGIRVKFEVQEVRRSGPMTIRTMEAPFAISPMESRPAGGGYVIVDLKKTGHVDELCRQAADDLAGWLRRYGAALERIGETDRELKRLIARLENPPKGKLSLKAASGRGKRAGAQASA